MHGHVVWGVAVVCEYPLLGMVGEQMRKKMMNKTRLDTVEVVMARSADLPEIGQAGQQQHRAIQQL